MPTSSADPFQLTQLACGQRTDAEELLIHLAPLDEALASLRAGSDPALLGRLPDAVGDGRQLGSRLLAEAEWVARVADAFERADGGARRGPVTVADGALAAAFDRTQPVDGLAYDLTSMSPAAVAALLGELDPATLERLVSRHPAIVGNTDGVPPALRYRANHLRVAHDLSVAEAQGNRSKIEGLRTLAGDQVIVYDTKHRRIAVVFGDLSTARHVAVAVPGMDSPFDGFTGRPRTYGADLHAEMARQGTGGVATVAWLGYDSPSRREVAIDDDAVDGAHRLRTFVNGMGLGPEQSLTLVGHSYGTLVVAKAERGGAGARNVVLLGSPGVEMDSASDLQVPEGGGVYAERAPEDLVGDFAGAYGPDPAAFGFGGIRMTTNASGAPRVTGHSNYFTPGSEALRNTAAVATGNQAAVQSPTLGERVAAVDARAPSVLRSGSQIVGEAARHYNGPGHEVVEVTDRIYKSAERSRETIERNAVDGGVKAIKKAGDLAHDAVGAVWHAAGG